MQRGVCVSAGMVPSGVWGRVTLWIRRTSRQPEGVEKTGGAGTSQIYRRFLSWGTTKLSAPRDLASVPWVFAGSAGGPEGLVASSLLLALGCVCVSLGCPRRIWRKKEAAAASDEAAASALPRVRLPGFFGRTGPGETGGITARV